MTRSEVGPFEIVHTDTSLLERPDWLALRSHGIGSSDAAPAMGMSPWTSAYSLWAEKRGLLAETPDNERFLWGRLHEPLIIAQAHARGWIRGPVTCGLMLRSVDYPWMLANPDGLTDREVVESKTADQWDEARWDIGVPDHYVIQGHHLMIVTGRQWCVFPVLFGGNNLRCFEVEFDPRLASSIIEATRLMWQRIKENDAPDADGSEATMLALRQVFTESIEGEVIDLGEEWIERLNSREHHTGVMKQSGVTVNEVKAALMKQMGTAQVAKLFGETVATWKPTKNGNRTFLFKESK